MTRAEPSTVVSPPPAADLLWTVHQRDARETGTFLEGVAAEGGHPNSPFITATVTSPPYANLVDYGPNGQIGFGQTYEEYLDECEAIFRDVFSWTVDEGSLWLVADTLMSRGTGGAPSALVPLPFALAERASRAGWTLRDVIVWRKDRTRPWASAGRLRNGFEYILYFVKGPDFKHHVDRLRDLRGIKNWWVKYPERHNPWGMTPDNVWEIPIPVQGSWASNELRHACPFPQELVRRAIELTTDEGDVVFDPFAGSGMVPAVAESLGRVPLGTELSREFCKVYTDWVRPTVLGSASMPLDVDSLDITATLLGLRALKFPKILLNQIMRAGVSRDELIGALLTSDAFDLTPKESPYAAIDCVLIVPTETPEDDLQRISESAARAMRQAPLSRWGLTARVTVRRLQGVRATAPVSERVSLYTGGRTWRTSGTLDWAEALAAVERAARRGVPPIISPLYLSVELEDER